MASQKTLIWPPCPTQRGGGKEREKVTDHNFRPFEDGAHARRKIRERELQKGEGERERERERSNKEESALCTNCMAHHLCPQ